jgi:hypothetical protein
MGLGYYWAGRDRLSLSSPLSNPGDNRILVNYYAIPLPLEDEEDLDAEIEVPYEYTDVVVQGVVARSYLKRREYEEYQLQKQEYELLLNRAIKAEGRRQGNKQLNIVR